MLREALPTAFLLLILLAQLIDIEAAAAATVDTSGVLGPLSDDSSPRAASNFLSRMRMLDRRSRNRGRSRGRRRNSRRRGQNKFGNPFDAVCENDQPLGLISGDVKNWQITASSTYPASKSKGCDERYARLYQRNRYSWCAKYKSSSEWLQVDLGVTAQVTGVMTQGRGDGLEFVRSFMLSYSEDAQTWKFVSDQYRNQRIFEANSDSYSVKHNYLDEPVRARFLKFHVQSWSAHPSMRVEVLGCQPCRTLLGLPPYGRLTASSARGMKSKKTCAPPYGHILSNKAWCARRQDGNQWLQIDLGPPTYVTGVVIKGRGDGRRLQWVRSFRLAYSNDSNSWFFYKDAVHLGPKIFAGNTDKNTERVHYLNRAFVARFVRFHPVSWQGRLAMRAGVFGCPHRGNCGTGFLRINKHSHCVANLAYGKRAWVNVGGQGSRHRKRNIRPHWHRGQALKAVDGRIDQGLHSCTVLNNVKTDVPAWFVDLRSKQDISGVVIYTWQGSGNYSPRTTYTEYLSNLDRLAVYVDRKPRRRESITSPNLCGYVTRLNNALFAPKVHIQCRQPMRGRYVYVEAWGVANRWSKHFNAILCEVMVY